MPDSRAKFSLLGSVSLGTGVMIGAGIFALVGQVAALAGGFMPLAFLAGALVVAFSAYSYVKYSNTNPTSGGIAMLLKAAYGSGVVAGSFSFFMYVSMVVAESLLARTFGTYVLRPFGLEGNAFLVPALGVLAISLAALVNIFGNRLVEGSAMTTAAAKIVGLAVLAVAGIAASGLSSFTGIVAPETAPEHGILGFLAGTTLCILAYKGFTTITNQGADVRDAKRNIGRSIAISIALCAALYLLITTATAASLDVADIVKARDYAIAAAADPLFGAWGVVLTIAIAIIATLSGLLASLYSVSRLYEMLHDMGQAPVLPGRISHQSLVITVGLAILVTVFFDLSQIASMGALLYITMDIAVHWGVIRRLHSTIGARRWVPVVAIVLDAIVLFAFVAVKVRSDLLTVSVTVAIALAIFLNQWWFASHKRS
ncbi:APC family permease [Cryobacterium tepidiphilum]|uniref:APC family permease n=1 Tax=Cryobacterium tepidiphilum TaxID=2486026 RepID=A0A3M8L9T2_9MICO|nr:APC family permease [Cryobacterium tepidiphilum]RNE62196.1 APC family permease [Cryobacterium tepidiphilum]